MAVRAIPTHNGSSAKSSLPPNQTLYITSLPTRSSTLTKHDLRLSLYTLFSTYGPVLDVVAMKTAKMRGQAHVVFRDVRDATQALRAENGREFFGSTLNVQYAKGKSNTIKKLDGTFKMPEAAKKEAEVQSTSLQQAIFGAPPGSLPTIPPSTAASLPPIPPPPAAALRMGEKAAEMSSGDASRGASEGPQGMKRAREESDEEEAPMEEDSDEDVEMEEESGDSD